MELIKSMLLDDLMASPVGQRLQQAMADWNLIQESLSAFRSSDDSNRLKLLKIGSVFQLFLIDFLASGKKFNELTEDDWRGIAEEVSRYAIKEEDYPYSVFVFSRYADYIRISANSIGKLISKDRWDSIMALAGSIDTAGERFRRSEINESEYVQACLWDSLEAMIKLFSSSLTSLIGEEYTQLAEAVSQFAFEYGRYLLYAKERALLDEYIQHQYVLDEELNLKYTAYLEELQAYSDRFMGLINSAFSSDIRQSLQSSAELARMSGVREEDILKDIDNIDNFFMN